MIKFFRKIRQKLLEQNKVSKYLIYALGEIILVVIGILIALQINNWNENRQNKKRINSFIEKLKLQNRNNITKIDENIALFQNKYKTSIRLLSIIGSENTSSIDAKIDSLIGANFSDYHLNLDLNVINEGRENGDLALLPSSKLRQALYNLTTENAAIIERERITNEDLNLLFVPYLNKNYNFRNRSPLKNIGKSKLYTNDNFKLLSDQEFENYIISRIEYNENNLLLYTKMKKHLETISQLLKSL